MLKLSKIGRAFFSALAGTLWACGAAKAPPAPVEQEAHPIPPNREGTKSSSGRGEEGKGTASRDSTAQLPEHPPRAYALGSSAPAAVADEPIPLGNFPPPDPGMLFPRSAREGDGKFEPFFAGNNEQPSVARARKDVPVDFLAEVVRRIVLHPHEVSPFQTLTVAAFDLRFLFVEHRPGSQDVQDVGHGELLDRAGLVPRGEQSQLVAVFNGGFQPRHGRWGMFSLGTQLIPPRNDACTVAVLNDGTVKIAPWPEIESLLPSVVAYRQTPPCLVHDGIIAPRLLQGDRGPWAGQIKDRKTRRRSVVGLSEDGRTLFFGVGSETEPEILARGIRHAGASSAAQLDINWNWTRLFLFDSPSGPGDQAPLVAGSLILNMAKDKGEYLTRPSGRGFFYIRRRSN